MVYLMNIDSNNNPQGDDLKTIVAGFTLAFLAVAAAQAQEADDFIRGVQKNSAGYTAITREPGNIELIKAGHVSQVDAKLKALVPDDKKQAGDYFVLGNMLYGHDPDASDAAMKRAEALLPDEPAVWLERGMHEHRNGNCKDATVYYDKFHATAQGKDHQSSWAYAAQCRLVLGDAKGALADWKHVDFGRYHIGIEQSMGEIFFKYNPDREREKKVDLVNASTPAGRVEALCDLVDLDTNWKTNWWNAHVYRLYLNYDTDAGKHLLEGDAAGLAQFALCGDVPGLSAEALQKRLADAGYWGDKPSLPESPTLAYIVIKRLSDTHSATPEAILAAYGDSLEARLKAHPTGQRTLDVLAFLFSGAKERAKLAPIDLQGWKSLHLQPYAESYLIGKSIAPDADYQQQVNAAAAEFPNSAVLARLQMKAEQDPARKAAYKIHYVATQFANVADPVANGGAGLGNFMAELAQEDAGR